MCFIKHINENKEISKSHEQSVLKNTCSIIGTWLFDEKVVVSFRPSSLQKIVLRSYDFQMFRLTC